MRRVLYTIAGAVLLPGALLLATTALASVVYAVKHSGLSEGAAAAVLLGGMLAAVGAGFGWVISKDRGP